MEPRAVYETLINDGELSDLERKVFEALKKHSGGLSRERLVAICYGVSVRAGATTNNNSKDRRVRLAIARLRMRMVPIVSSSQGAGYRLDTSSEGRHKMMMDLISRRNKLTDMINRISKAYEIPVEMPPAENATQEALL